MRRNPVFSMRRQNVPCFLGVHCIAPGNGCFSAPGRSRTCTIRLSTAANLLRFASTNGHRSRIRYRRDQFRHGGKCRSLPTATPLSVVVGGDRLAGVAPFPFRYFKSLRQGSHLHDSRLDLTADPSAFLAFATAARCVLISATEANIRNKYREQHY